MDKILEEVADAITPNKKEREKLKSFSKKVIKLINKQGYAASVEGSLAKDTWISGNHDIDVFLFFDRELNKKVLEKEGVAVGKKAIKELGGVPELAYSEHPYTRSKINDIDLDIVPCYKLENTEQKASSVDRTPFHTKYVLENMTEKQKTEVRILKQFSKGIGVYSAKEKVRGFSGYLCELLILQYGTFKKLAKQAATKWEYGLVIDIEKLHKNKKKIFKRFQNALIVIDPTDRLRNVAAALDEDNFEKLIQAFQYFLQKPTVEFFFPNLIEPFTQDKLQKQLKKRGKIFIIKFKTPDIQEDILYSQLRKSLKTFKKKLDYFDFDVMQTDYYSSEKYSYLLVEVQNTELPELKVLEGPPISIDKKYQDAFEAKYKERNPWIKNRRWYVNVPRKYTIVEDLLKNILKEPDKNGITKYVTISLKEEKKLIDEKNLLKEYKEEFARFLTRYLSKKNPWEW
jgi:tRNA nucleotidyltransferase (CCA-adding enzyme)